MISCALLIHFYTQITFMAICYKRYISDCPKGVSKKQMFENGACETYQEGVRILVEDEVTWVSKQTI